MTKKKVKSIKMIVLEITMYQRSEIFFNAKASLADLIGFEDQTKTHITLYVFEMII